LAYYDLNRRFVERESYDQDELIAAQLRGKLVGWTKVLENRSSVIVAAANFGKTTEMCHQAAQLRANGETAVFIALRQLADRGSLDKALDGDDRDAYRAWKAAPVGRITVFVDSLDEAAAAGKDESISHLVGDVADELNWPNEHVRWVISTRPAVLTTRASPQKSNTDPAVMHRIAMDRGTDFGLTAFQLQRQACIAHRARDADSETTNGHECCSMAADPDERRARGTHSLAEDSRRCHRP
jgi:hypothetical protein